MVGLSSQARKRALGDGVSNFDNLAGVQGLIICSLRQFSCAKTTSKPAWNFTDVRRNGVTNKHENQTVCVPNLMKRRLTSHRKHQGSYQQSQRTSVLCLQQ
jgi:hypothetical protein